MNYIDYLTASSLSQHSHNSIISVDFEKAFDRIGIHSILFYSFLTNRKIKIRVKNAYSTTENLNNGIPQGSPLSVILFKIATLLYPMINTSNM